MLLLFYINSPQSRQSKHDSTRRWKVQTPETPGLFGGQELNLTTRSTSSALHTDCLPACNPLKRDWSILLELQTDYKQKLERFRYQNLGPLSTDICLKRLTFI